jgi:hypothetical protein
MTNGEAHNAFYPIVGLTFIRWCTTSKCNYLTYNTSLYTREKEERGKRKKETVQLVRGKRKERTLKEVIVEREVISHTRYEP